MPDDPDKEVLIPEVLPPDRGQRSDGAFRRPPPPAPPRPRVPLMDRALNSTYPILIGLIVDYINFEAIGRAGFFVGAVGGIWFASASRLPCALWLWAVGLSAWLGASKTLTFVPLFTITALFMMIRPPRRPPSPFGR